MMLRWEAISQSTGGCLMTLILISGCSGVRSRQTTWDQDQAEGILQSRKKYTGSSTRLQLSPDAFSLDVGSVASRLERALIEFGSRRRRRGAPKSAAAWPQVDQVDWLRLLDEIERAFTHPPGSLPRRLLLQVRVVLDAEREQLSAATGPPPRTIDRRIALAFVEVAQRLAAQRLKQDRMAEQNAEPRMMWPVSPIILTSGFGYRRDPIYRDGRLGFHAGIDLAGSQGDPVLAAQDGEVIAAGWNGGLGRAVFVQHRGGYTTVYAHLSRVLVKQGALIPMGTAVGLMGRTGRATGAHLHFEVRLGGTPMNPTGFLTNHARPTADRGTLTELAQRPAVGSEP